MSKIELFYNSKIKISRPFSELSQDEIKHLESTLSYAFFDLNLSLTALKNSIFDAFIGIFRKKR